MHNMIHNTMHNIKHNMHNMMWGGCGGGLVLSGVGWGGARVVQGWCGCVAGVVWGRCRGGEGVVCFGKGVTSTVIDVKWVTHALCSDVLNALFEFPSKIRLYQRVTFICLWVISQ